MKQILFSIIVVTILVSGASVSRAAITEYTLLEPLPCVPTSGQDCKPGSEIKTFTVNQFIEYVFKFSIALAVLLATIQVIIGGFQYMGEQSYSSKSAAKTRFTNAAIGLGGVLVSFLILQTIDPRLVRINTEIQSICPKSDKTPGSICNKDEARLFISQLETDLQNLSTQNKNEVYAREKVINDLATKRAEIQAKIERGEDQNENFAELAKVDQQIKEERSKTVQQIVTGSSQKYFFEALQGLNSNNAFTDILGNPNSTLNESAKINAQAQKEKIREVYNKWISDPSLSPEEKQSLQFRKNFYVNQITEHQDLLERVAIYNQLPSDTTSEKNAKTALTATQSEYQAQIDFLATGKALPAALASNSALATNLTWIKKDPVLLPQYNTLLRDRINAINTAEQKKPIVPEPGSVNLTN